MYTEVQLYVKSCDTCQRTAAQKQKFNRPLQPIAPPDNPWQHIGVDLICDLPKSRDGYLHVLVVVCYLSKYVVARALKSKRSREVIDQLRSIYLTYGTPDVIQHDQGPEFRSKEFKLFHEALKVDNRSTAAYHPQSNGLVEAHNTILKVKIEKFRLNSEIEWPDRLQEACLASNTHLKKATKATPFKLMFGRNFNPAYLFNQNFEVDEDYFPSEDENESLGNELLKSIYEPADDCNEWVEHMDLQRNSDLQMASDNIKQEQIRQKRIFDLKVQQSRSTIQVSDEILIRNVKKDKKLPGTKTQPKYFGPYTVKQLTKGHVVVSEKERKRKKVPFHLTKKYLQRNIQFQQSKACSPNLDYTNSSEEDLGNYIINNECGNSDIGAMIEIFESSYTPTISQDIFDGIRCKVMQTLEEGSYLSPLHRELDEKSKYMRFTDIISYHPSTSFTYTFKEKVACLISQWYNEYLDLRQVEENEYHKQNYPLTVLLPVVFEYIMNLEVQIEPESAVTYPTLELHKPSNVGNFETHSFKLESLCPVWQGEFGGILHQNTCSIDNVISLLSLYIKEIQMALKFTEITQNSDVEQIFSLLQGLRFDELRDFIAKLTEISITYDVIVQTYDFFGSESRIIKALRKLDVCNDVYYCTLQCYNCSSSFSTKVQLGSIRFVTSSLQSCIDNKLVPNRCRKCRSTNSNLELLVGHFQALPPLLVVELGHLSELNCKLKTNDIDEIISITNDSRSLCYKLAGYTLYIGNHFFLMISINNVWYKYDDIKSPKLVEWGKSCSLGKINSIFYILQE